MRILQKGERQFVVGRTVLDRIETLLDEAETGRKSEGRILGLRNDRLHISTISAEQRDAEANLLGAIRDAILTGCEVRSCPRAAELDPDERDRYRDTVGRHTLDSILLASAPDAVLWSDDLYVGILAEADFQTQRVWTQPILRRLVDEGVVAEDEYHRATAKLAGWHYQGTFWDANTIVAAAKLAEWHLDRWPVSTILTSVDSSETGLRIAAEAIRVVWRSGVANFTRQAFLFAILGRYDSLSIIERIRRIVAVAFALDVTAAIEVNELTWTWVSTTPKLLLP